MKFFRNILTLVGIGISFIATVVNADRTEHIGKSGKISIFPSDNSERFITMSLDKLEEVKPNFQSIGWNTPALSSQTFSWSQSNNYNLNGINVTEVSLTSIQKVGGNSNHAPTVDLLLNTKIFSQDIYVYSGNQTVNVPKNTLKWTINLEHWPWKNQNNLLKFGINLKFKEENNQEIIKNNNDLSTKLIFPQNCQFDLINFGISDGNVVPITYNIFWKGGLFYIEFYFPYFYNTFEYDPILSFGNYNQESSTYNFNRLSIILLFIQLIFFI
jgi:hypothetical protein